MAVTPYVQDVDFTLYNGDALEILRVLPDASVDCCVTSPPYWGLRNYDVDGQLGLEPTPDEYVARMVVVFREVRRVLTDAGTLWLNLGDSYVSDPGKGGSGTPNGRNGRGEGYGRDRMSQVRDGKAVHDNILRPYAVDGLRPKNLVGIPWRVAFALQADGWWLRSDIIWSKPNPMPESVTDRPTKSHEYVFLLSKRQRYWFDQDAVREMYAPASEDRYRYAFGGAKSEALAEADKNGIGVRTRPIGMRQYGGAKGPDGRRNTHVEGASGSVQHRAGERWPNSGRNLRSVWEIPTQPYPAAHFAVFPEALPERCIKAGCPAGGAVLDPFGGSGTTALVARKLGRRSVLIELNGSYCELAAKRLQQLSLLAEGAA